MNEYIDEHDWKRLLTAVLRYAMEDVVRLAHPKTRQKKYLNDAYKDAVDMFWDNSYLMQNVFNQEGSAMDLHTLLSTTIENDLVDIAALKRHLTSETVEYWDKKDINTLHIPDTFIVEGTPWRVFHSNREEYSIDFDECILHIKKDSSDPNQQQQFFYALMEITFDNLEIRISRNNLRKLSGALFLIFKINNCFVGINQNPKSSPASYSRQAAD